MTANRKSLCRAALIDRILRLDLAPGAELEETRLAAEYGLSRTPLREIFQALAGEGYLALQTNRGARVAPLDVGVLRNFFRTAPLIYTSVARLAAENRSEADLSRLAEIQTRFLAALDARDAIQAAVEDHAFRLCIGEAAGNPYLMPALRRLLIDHARLSHDLFDPASKKERKQVKKAAQQREALIAAFRARAAEEAVALTLQLWEQARERMERHVRPQPLPLEAGGLAQPAGQAGGPEQA